MNNLNIKKWYKAIIPVLIIFFSYQCMHDEYEFDKLDDEMELEAGVLSPLAYGSLNFEDIISEFDSSGLINTDADGLLYLTYTDSLFSFVANELLEIPEQSFFEYFIESDFSFSSSPPWTIVKEEKHENFPFTFDNNESLDSIQLDEGDLILNITSDFQHTGKVDMIFPNIRLNGTALTHTINITDATGSFTANPVIPIDGYTIHLKDSVGNDTAFLPVDFYVELYNEGNPVNAGDQIEIQATMSALDFEAIFGYIGQDYELLSETGEMDLGFFQSPLDGYIYFESPQLNFTMQNSYGVPAEIDISKFKGFDNSGDSTSLDLNPSVNPFRYAYPTLTDYGNSDIFKDTVIAINSSNSNLSDFLAFMPSKLEFNMSAKSNPDGEGGSYNFVTDDSKIDVGVEFILPLYFKADSFALMDTVDLDFEEIDEDADFIENVNLMLEVRNGMPLDIDFQIYFLDASYNHVDTLFSDQFVPVIESALINSDNTVSDPGIKTSIVEYNNEDINKLNTVRYGLVRAGLKTPNDSNGDLVSVKFFRDYKVNFNLSISINIKANTEDL